MYQLVFGTDFRQPTLIKGGREDLYAYMRGILANKKCHCYRIGGVEDHLHILTHIHPTVPVDRLIKDLKLAASKMIKSERLFPSFAGWQEGYGAFTYAVKEKDRLIEYIKNQEEHHRKISFRDEYRQLLKEHNIPFEEKYLL